jgi:hypothetical protein
MMYVPGQSACCMVVGCSFCISADEVRRRAPPVTVMHRRLQAAVSTGAAASHAILIQRRGCSQTAGVPVNRGQ